MLNSDIGFEPLDLALVIAARLQANGLGDEALSARVDALTAGRRALVAVMAPADARRTPWFCSGCPHNTSTRIPRRQQGAGRHRLPRAWRCTRGPNTLVPTQMGGEGAQWVGLRRYTSRPHVFQNLGDGTYYHSGLLAIRAAVASGANITYKILYNDAVAMTGGQPVDGAGHARPHRPPGAPRGRGHHRAGQRRPRGRHQVADLPPGTRIEHRDRLDTVQRELR